MNILTYINVFLYLFIENYIHVYIYTHMNRYTLSSQLATLEPFPRGTQAVGIQGQKTARPLQFLGTREIALGQALRYQVRFG